MEGVRRVTTSLLQLLHRDTCTPCSSVHIQAPTLCCGTQHRRSCTPLAHISMVLRPSFQRGVVGRLRHTFLRYARSACPHATCAREKCGWGRKRGSERECGLHDTLHQMHERCPSTAVGSGCRDAIAIASWQSSDQRCDAIHSGIKHRHSHSSERAVKGPSAE